MWAHGKDALLVAAGIVLAALAAKSKDTVRALLDLLGRRVLDFLVGRNLFTRRAVRAYVHRLHTEHRRFHVSFQPGSSSDPMNMRQVYVRLGLATGAPAGGRGAPASLADKERAVVLGAPGAGKTMLLRHTVLTWVLERYRPQAPGRRAWYGRRRAPRADMRDLTHVPVLVPLGRIDPAVSLRDQIVTHLSGLGFRNAGRWLDRMLGSGGVALYFDGLDEVTTAHRPDVVRMLREFLSEHHRCRAVITCRVAVYEGEFNEDFGAPLHVEPFDDTQIDRFLHAYPWPADLEPNTADQLLGVLRDTPQLMSLATNPLLLTMVAYLHSTVYAGTDEQLPHTRSDFYKEVVGALLDDRRRTRHPRPVKLAALRRIALAAQDVPSGARDRLALEEKDVLRHIEAALEEQRRESSPEKALEVLAEIVERTGLLLRIDGGVRYQFAHLTLQEYLAATALAGDAAALLDRYGRDPAAWRETVRLWCGAASGDCTEVVGEVFARDPVLAFRCLADAHVVDRALSLRIIADTHQRLDASLHAAAFQEVTTAFGVVAADRRDPGPEVFRLLTEAVQSATVPKRQRAAMYALAATHMPRAAEFLADQLVRQADHWVDSLHMHLVGMGNLAIPALRKLPFHPLVVQSEAEIDRLWMGESDEADDADERQPRVDRALVAMDALWRIGTPAAARALLTILTGGRKLNPQLAGRCAVYLGDLLARPEIQQSVEDGPAVRTPQENFRVDRQGRFGPAGKTPEDYAWVWRRCTRHPHEAMLSAVALVAWWVERGGGGVRYGDAHVDPRIVTALAVGSPSSRYVPVGI